jgi:cysteine-rich repeat protein
VDLLFHGSNQRQLEYDFLVSPGADPGRIRLGFEGASRPKLDGEGSLVLRTPEGELIERAPVAYQEIGRKRRPVAIRYAIERQREVVFRVGAYDRNKPLIIDPVLQYSIFLGGTSGEYGMAIAVDGAGNAYVTGTTSSHDFPTLNPFQGSLAGYPGTVNTNDAFVTKFNPDGSLAYSTYLGGTSADVGFGIAVDASGSAYVTGETSSSDFPTLNPFQAAMAGVNDAFVVKLSPSGDALVYSTYLGGSLQDTARGIAVDASGSAYVTGTVVSPDFPTVNALQTSRLGFSDAFVTKLAPGGAALAYSTYLGGGGSDGGTGIALGAVGNAHLVGETDSSDFPTVNPAQPSGGGDADAFVASLAASGTALVYSTYLGGNGPDRGAAIAVDASGSAYVAGLTESPDFPTLHALQASLAGPRDAFVAKLSSSGSPLVYSTYLGGNSADHGAAIGVDSLGHAYVAGVTLSNDFPTVDPVQGTKGAFFDAFLAELAADGGSLLFSTYFDGSAASGEQNEFANGVAMDFADRPYVVGFTEVEHGPDYLGGHKGDAGSHRTEPAGGGDSDAFVFRLGPPLCSDGIDNGDAEDALADAADPGCHSDRNPANPASYDPADDDEANFCGDGIVESGAGEECDDGNNANGDGCSSTCQIESQNQPPDCSGTAASPSALWPPDHAMVAVAITGLTDPDGDPVSITVDSIRQDEPVTASGSGNTCPDATGVETSTTAVRAERAGTPEVPGDGRVYHIAFTGRDPAGAACTGVATVCVPHDRQPGATCIDQGPLYDSTECPDGSDPTLLKGRMR